MVGRGMTNDIQHYKRVVSAMIDARWENLIDFDQFSDLDRVMVGSTKWEETDVTEEIEKAKDSIQAWMNYYAKNRWENQPYYPEILIEKKALQGVFQTVSYRYDVAMGACKGYPSLTFLHDLSLRMKEAEEKGKTPIILYFGDYDASGEDIPRSIQENLSKFGVEVEVRRIALMEAQVVEWNLPPAPTKESDTRAANWDGLGQVELDAVKPEKLQRLCSEAIESLFDDDLYTELKEVQKEERETYRAELKAYVQTL
ncbi:MAG: hypothetical protein WC238_04555 [Parcubacteria group bacterium]